MAVTSENNAAKRAARSESVLVSESVRAYVCVCVCERANVHLSVKIMAVFQQHRVGGCQKENRCRCRCRRYYFCCRCCFSSTDGNSYFSSYAISVLFCFVSDFRIALDIRFNLSLSESRRTHADSVTHTHRDTFTSS